MSGDTGGSPRATLRRVGRDLANEVVVNILSAVALGALAFVLLGGRIDDLYMAFRGGAPTSDEVAILGLDEETFYLWNPADPTPEVTPRALLAELVRFLHAAGAKVVVLDILTDVPATDDDALRAALEAHGRVVVAERFAPGIAGDPTPFAAGSIFSEVALPAYANLGMEEQTLFSGEMAVRAVPLAQAVARARLSATFPMGLVGGWQDDDAPTPAVALAGAWLQRSSAPRENLAAALAERCGGAPLLCTAGPDWLGLPPAPVPLHEALPLNFRGPEGGDGIPFVSGARALRSLGESALARTLGMDLPLRPPEDLVATLKGRVVVVGRTDAAANDRFVTPFAFPAMQTADMAGVRIHAQLIDTLLTGRQSRRVGGAVGAWVAALVLGALVVWTARFEGALHLVGWLVGSALLLAVGIAAFAQFDGLVLDVGPALAVVACTLLGVHVYARAAQGG
ncbi:MAG: CHASE2 domain-containing protein [Pseudomonadota bacterium]|nr:CHASE2 domain-containing protein [Pseudomonadota bacterium]